MITSAESTNAIHNGMKALQELFPESPFYGNGFPAIIIIDDSSAEREGLKKTWPSNYIIICVHSTFCRASGVGIYAVRMVYIKMKGSI